MISMSPAEWILEDMRHDLLRVLDEHDAEVHDARLRIAREMQAITTRTSSDSEETQPEPTL